jgi:hypothetical protein
MSVNRAFWKRTFSEKAFPSLPCPSCETGKVKLAAEHIHILEPSWSISQRSSEDWEPDWDRQRFSARLVCDEAACGEIVMVAGDTVNVSVYMNGSDGGYEGWGYEYVLRIQTVFPAPPLFPISVNYPLRVSEKLRLAFQLFWTDIPSCVAMLRTSVELMLDEQGVPREQVNSKGKTERMDLFTRIDAYGAKFTATDVKGHLNALRLIGNLGTHGSKISEDALFDAADVFEDVLLDIYEKKSIKAKVKKITDTKGVY